MTKFIIWALIVILTIIMLSGCGTEKKLLRQKVKQDSSTITKLQEEVKLTKQENVRLEAELKQIQYAGVNFNCPPCPTIVPVIHVDSTCNIDSVKNALTDYYGTLYQNKVKILSDGTLEAQGRLSSAMYNNTLYKKIIEEKDIRLDSFATALKAEKQNIKTVEVVMDKWKKTSLPLWWLIVAFVAGAIVWSRFGYQIKLFIKHITTKWA